MSEFRNQVVVVTGAAGNLGEATAKAFRARGARLALLDHKRDYLQSAFGDVLPEDDETFYGEADLTDEASVAAITEAIIAQFGQIDVLANIAGGFTKGQPVHETPLKTWDFMLALNARTVFLTSRAVIPHMLRHGRGKIINIGARAGLEGQKRMAPYIVSKSAVIRLTESMAEELKDSSINVNCILPGTIDTPRNREDMPNADYSKWVPPEALADVIVFLASEAARAVQGAAVPVYGRS